MSGDRLPEALPLRLDHGVSETRPVAIKHDVWRQAGPGQFDMHYELELGIVRAGCMERYVGDNTLTYGPGAIWFNGIWEPHKAQVVQAPLDLVMFHIHPPMLARLSFAEAPGIQWLRFFTAAVPDRPPPDALPASEVIALADAALGVAGDRDDWAACLLLRNRLVDLLVAVARRYPVPDPLARPAADEYAMLGRAMELVFEHTKSVTVAEAAELCGMNRNHFSRRFRTLTGLSFPEFSMRFRLRSAASALANSEEPIKAIASTWGFVDASHFHRCFSTLFGVSPARYRAQVQAAEPTV